MCLQICLYTQSKKLSLSNSFLLMCLYKTLLFCTCVLVCSCIWWGQEFEFKFYQMAYQTFHKNKTCQHHTTRTCVRLCKHTKLSPTIQMRTWRARPGQELTACAIFALMKCDVAGGGDLVLSDPFVQSKPLFPSILPGGHFSEAIAGQ